MHTGLLKGKRDLASGNNFYVYDNGLDDDDDMDSAWGRKWRERPTRTTTPRTWQPMRPSRPRARNMATAITGVSSTPITFGSESVTVEPDVHRGRDLQGYHRSAWQNPEVLGPISKGVATVEPGLEQDRFRQDEGEDPMADGDHRVRHRRERLRRPRTIPTWSTASRMNPVGFDLLASDFVVEAPAGSDVVSSLRSDRPVHCQCGGKG